MKGTYAKHDNHFEPRNEEQENWAESVKNFGAYDQFIERSVKAEAFDMALEAVNLINQLPYLEYKEPAEGEEPEEKVTPWDVIDLLACESVGIDDETEMTPELLEDYNMVLSQMTHALGSLSGAETGRETAVESVNSEDNDRLAKMCIHIEEQLNYHGETDEELAIEYVLDAPVVLCDYDGEEVAVESIKKVMRDGKKFLKDTKNKLRGARKAMAKKLGRKLGRLKKSAAQIKKQKRSFKKGQKAGLY